MFIFFNKPATATWICISICLFVRLFPRLFVCSFAGLHKNYWASFHEIQNKNLDLVEFNISVEPRRKNVLWWMPLWFSISLSWHVHVQIYFVNMWDMRHRKGKTLFRDSAELKTSDYPNKEYCLINWMRGYILECQDLFLFYCPFGAELSNSFK